MKRILLYIFILCSLQSFGAKILTPFGYKEETSLIVGDMVIGQNGDINFITGKRTLDEAWFKDQHNVYEWYSINGTYHFFGNQNIIVAHGKYGVCHVSELKRGWSIYNDHGEEVVINTIRKININRIWYRFDISGDHTYIADEIILHNASRFWNKQNASANWNATAPTNWGSSSGTADGASFPGASDAVTFDGAGAGGNAASTNSATITVLSLTFTSGYTNTVTLNAVPTIAGNFTDNTAHSWAGSSGLTISAASTITSGGKTFPNGVTFSGTNTKTLSGNWVISGALTLNGTTVLNWTTNETLSCAGFAGNFPMSGTAKVILTGGTWNNNSALSNNTDIAGNVTLSGSIIYNTGTLAWVSGSVTQGSSTLTIASTTTLNTAGITFNNITLNGAFTLTLNSLLTVAGTLTINPNFALTFAGTGGFTAATFTCSHTAATTLTFNDAATFTITTAFNAFLSRNGSILLFTSDDATNRVPFILNQGATCNVLANFTRINNTGRTIRSFNGVITDCIGVVAFNDIGTSKH